MSERMSPDDFGIGQLFESIRDAVIVAELRSGRIVLWNPAAVEIFGYTADEIVGRELHTLVPEELKAAHQAGIARYAETRKGDLVDSHAPVELPAITRDGNRITVELQFAPIDTSPDGGVYMAGFIRDISERKALEAEGARLASALQVNHERLQLAFDKEKESVKRLRDLDALKTEFVAMVAHDLRSPMTVIGGMADTMRDKWDRLEDMKKLTFLDMISHNIARLSELVEDVLVVARLESEEFRYKLEPFDIVGLASRIAEQMRGDESSDEARKIDIVAADDVPYAYADEKRNWQILTNLVSNALKFSEDQIEIDITREDPDAVKVAIVDHGIGMDPDELSKLFQKFSRLTQRGSDRKVAGTGLGLYICKRMVEDQGGKIGVTSELGSGSTFWYTLPATGKEAG